MKRGLYRHKQKETHIDIKRGLYRYLDIIEAFDIGCKLIGTCRYQKRPIQISKEAHVDMKRDPYRYQNRPIQI